MSGQKSAGRVLLAYSGGLGMVFLMTSTSCIDLNWPKILLVYLLGCLNRVMKSLLSWPMLGRRR